MAGERRRRLDSVRVRTTVGATVVVSAALVVGAVVLVGLLRRNLVANVEASARLRAEDVATLLEDGTTPDEIAIDDEDGSLIQVVDRTGQVVAASENVLGEPAVLDPRAEPPRTLPVLPMGGEGPYRIATDVADTAEGQLTVVVARTLDPAQESIAAMATALALGLPLLALIVAATTWVVTGRALRPVESIRAEVTEITNAHLDRRVPVPGGDDEIARLARTMNEMLSRLEGARDRQREFVSDASHELRSPIATIRLDLEVLLANPDTSDTASIVRGVLSEGLRMEGLVENLLILARSDEGEGPATRRPIDLDDLLLAESARLRGRVEVDASAVSAGQVTGDHSQLARVVRNLVDNAERHSTSKVTLALTEKSDCVRMTVTDDGPGIDAVDRERVFERFTRLDDARSRDAGGFGLGLAIVHQVVTAHGGRIRVEAPPSGGTSFVVEFPMAGRAWPQSQD